MKFWKLLRDMYARSPIKTVLALGFVAAISVLAAAAAQKADISKLTPQNINVTAIPIAFDPSRPDRRDFGRLEWRGGLVMTSPASFWGGYSGLALSAYGGQMLAVSDAGSWLSTKLTYQDGRLAGLSETRIGPIPQKDGQPLQNSSHRDAESLVSLDGGKFEGRYFIGFERFHRLDAYEFKDGALRGPIRRGGMPRQLKQFSSSNRGLEGVTILRGGPNKGALILFAERKLTKSGDHTGAMVREGKSYPLFLKRTGEFDVTALESLEDGSLLVLERSFIRSSFKLDIRLRLIPASEIKPGAHLKGSIILDADQRLLIDNFEGMAVHKTAEGETRITLISDDNFNFFQKTLLAQFALKTD